MAAWSNVISFLSKKALVITVVLDAVLIGLIALWISHHLLTVFPVIRNTGLSRNNKCAPVSLYVNANFVISVLMLICLVSTRIYSSLDLTEVTMSRDGVRNLGRRVLDVALLVRSMTKKLPVDLMVMFGSMSFLSATSVCVYSVCLDGDLSWEMRKHSMFCLAISLWCAVIVRWHHFGESTRLVLPAPSDMVEEEVPS